MPKSNNSNTTGVRNPVQPVKPTQAAESTKEQHKGQNCKHCDSNLAEDNKTGEFYCPDCGYIPDDQSNVSLTADWRSFNGTGEKSRVGSPETNTRHDKGLSTEISWQNKDGYGSTLSQKQKQKFRRLRKWDDHSKRSTRSDRTQSKGLGEISRMASALGLTERTEETAAMIFKQAHKNNIILGRSIEGVATASLHLATKIEDQPRPLRKFKSVARISIDRVKKDRNEINRQLNLSIKPTKPEKHLPRFTKKLDLDVNTQEEAKRLIQDYREQHNTSGEKPTAIASTALYTAALKTGREISQLTLSNTLPITDVTIRKKYKKMIDADRNSNIKLNDIKDDTVTMVIKKLQKK